MPAAYQIGEQELSDLDKSIVAKTLCLAMGEVAEIEQIKPVEIESMEAGASAERRYKLREPLFLCSSV